MAETDHRQGTSRITIVTPGTPHVMDQIGTCWPKDGARCTACSTSPATPTPRASALVKVVGGPERLVDALRIMHTRLVDTTPESSVFEMTGTSNEIDSFIHMLSRSR